MRKRIENNKVKRHLNKMFCQLDRKIVDYEIDKENLVWEMIDNPDDFIRLEELIHRDEAKVEVLVYARDLVKKMHFKLTSERLKV